MTPLLESESEYYGADDIVARYAAADYLERCEERLLERVRGSLGEWRMLDLGVGGGRTTVHFAPLARYYVGADFSREMVEACRRRFAAEEWPHARFEVADARELPYEDASFDFVFFSYNGLDCVGEEDERAQALREIRRVLRPGGLFAHSAHNIGRLRKPFSLRHAGLQALKWRLLNPRLRVGSPPVGAKVRDERHGLRVVSVYYVRADAELDRLAHAGFGEVEVFRPDGEPLPADGALAGREEPWLFYVSRAA